MRIYAKTTAAAIGIAILAAHPAYAQAFQPVDTALSMVVTAMTGTIARSIAIIATVLLGFAAMFGRITWNLAFSIVIGIAVVFGAGTIVDALRAV